MLNRFFGRFSEDIAIDLGTSNTRVFVKDKGIVMNEPSIVAINTRTNHILAVGRTAKDMLGKTPPHIVTTRPLTKGVISDFEVTEKMLKYFVDKIHEESFTLVPRPRIAMTVPMEITEVERKAVEDAALSAGAREVFLIESPLAAAIGAGLPIEDSIGNMIVDIGGGTTQIAVISLSGIVTWKSLTVAGDEMTKSITQYARDQFNLLIGEKIYLSQDREPADRKDAGLFTESDWIRWGEGLEREEISTDEQMRLIDAPMLPGLDL